MSTTTLWHLLPIDHLDFVVIFSTFSFWTCTYRVISRDVLGRFRPSIAYPSHLDIWSAWSNVNNNPLTLASHRSPWLYVYFGRNFVKISIFKVMVCEYEGWDKGAWHLESCIYMWDTVPCVKHLAVGTRRGSLHSLCGDFCTFYHYDPFFIDINECQTWKIEALLADELSFCK